MLVLESKRRTNRDDFIHIFILHFKPIWKSFANHYTQILSPTFIQWWCFKPVTIRTSRLVMETLIMPEEICNKDSHCLRSTLRWRHNDHDSVSNHQSHGCLFRRRSKKTSKFRVTGLCVGNSPGPILLPGPVNSPHKGQLRGKCFHLMTSSWSNGSLEKKVQNRFNRWDGRQQPGLIGHIENQPGLSSPLKIVIFNYEVNVICSSTVDESKPNCVTDEPTDDSVEFGWWSPLWALPDLVDFRPRSFGFHPFLGL